jgi:hypothetical protein
MSGKNETNLVLDLLDVDQVGVDDDVDRRISQVTKKCRTGRKMGVGKEDDFPASYESEKEPLLPYGHL